MNLYIGVKIIKATPMTKGEAEKKINRAIGGDYNSNDNGYLVIYPDNYESWSPKKVFEDAYREINPKEFDFIAPCL